MELPLANNHISVDCVAFGFDGERLKVLLVKRVGHDGEGGGFNDMKLPGSLIYQDEDLDEAAQSITGQLTGLRHPYIRQFRAFGSPDRTANPRDVLWLENAVKQKIGRIVTVAYLSLIRITGRTRGQFAGHDVAWYKVSDLPELAFDHNHIIAEALRDVQQRAAADPQLLFEMLPPKFTALQLRRLHEQIGGRSLDVRNFSKLILSKPYIVPLDEWEQGVSHRAARFYKFVKPKK